jgi:uncharacterized membrane protein (DUF373 family)
MRIMDKFFKPFEKTVIIALMIFMAIVLLISTFEVGVIIVKELINPIESKGIIIDINELVEIFGFFLNVLIGLELFETVKLYLKENVFHGEVILIIALIAISRKVIILDYHSENPLTIIAVALLIGTITLGYYFIKKAVRKE